MIEKKTIIDQIEIARDGTINIRFGLLLIEDGNELSCRWHRTTIEPGMDIDLQIAAVDDNLATGVQPKDVATPLKFPASDKTRIAQVKAVAHLVHTPEVVKAHKDRMAALKDEMQVMSTSEEAALKDSQPAASDQSESPDRQPGNGGRS